MQTQHREFKAALRHFMQAKGLGQKNIAEIVGCTTRTVQKALSDDDNEGFGRKKQAITAEFFGLDRLQFLSLGQHLIDGGKYTDWEKPVIGHLSTKDPAPQTKMAASNIQTGNITQVGRDQLNAPLPQSSPLIVAINAMLRDKSEDELKAIIEFIARGTIMT